MRIQAMVGRDRPAFRTSETRVADGLAIHHHRVP
jgi:hypothetical protein